MNEELKLKLKECCENIMFVDEEFMDDVLHDIVKERLIDTGVIYDAVANAKIIDNEGTTAVEFAIKQTSDSEFEHQVIKITPTSGL